MTPNFRRLMGLARACLLLGASVASQGAVIPPGTPLAAKQEMVRDNYAEPESLDPALVSSAISNNILVDLFETLVALDDHAHAVPGVAQSWQQTDATTWVFRLRGNASWSNGEPVTAQDFVHSWRRLVDPKTAAPLASTYGAWLLNGAAIVQGRMPVTALGVRAIDSLTLEVKTPGPLPYLPLLLTATQMSPVPRATVDRFGTAWTRPGNLVGNGAYVLKDWQVNGKLVVEKSPTYWDAANVSLTRVTYLPVEDGNADLKLYQSGEEDMTGRVPPGAYGALKAQFPEEMHDSRVIGMRFHALNNTDPLLKDVRVRQALSMVIDREVLASRITADGEAPLYGLTIAGGEGVDPVRYDWADWPMDRRVAEARRLLAAAGVKPGTRLEFAYDNSDFQKRVAVFTASEWKTKLGLDTDLESMELKVLIHKVHSGDYQVARHAWTPGFADISGFLQLVQCDSNDDRSCDKAGNELMRQAAAEADPARRRTLMTQAVRVEMADYPMIPLLQLTRTRLVKPWIGGYDDANDQDVFRSKDFYVIRH